MWAATEARALGRGGVALVTAATGLQRNTIRAGVRELEAPGVVPPVAEQRVRAPGGGRKPVTTQDPTLLRDLEALVDPVTRGDPMSPLRWTCKSTRELAVALQARGHRVSHQTVAELLHALRYSLQGNRKTTEGAAHPDRDAQFAHINAQTETFQQRGQPVISVDTKKQELVGDFKNGGREWQPAGQPEPVRVHDFVDDELGKAIPYGVYDLAANRGWVSVGTDHDTPTFAVQAVRSWWEQMGHSTYPCGDRVADHRRRRRQQRQPHQAVEDRAAAAGRRDRPAHQRLPLPARHQQVEQDRASDVLPHHRELARTTTRQPRGHRSTHRKHHHPCRPDHPC